MKSLSLILCSCLVFASVISYAQVASDIKPPTDGKIGEFSEWKKVDVSFNDGTTASVEYRIGLATRKGIACHYDMEVKNNSSIKLTIKMESSYYDKFVKSNFGEEVKESLKPGKAIVARLIAQGCKKDKGSDLDDYATCMACDFGVNLYVSK